MFPFNSNNGINNFKLTFALKYYIIKVHKHLSTQERKYRYYTDINIEHIST